MSLAIDGGGGGGISSATMRRLGEEDRRAIREAQAAEPPPPPPAAEPPPPAARPTTPREAVQALHAKPPPRTDDLAGLSWSVQQAMYQPRVEQWNDERRDGARDALARLAPQRSDFAGLPPRLAQAEYADARAQFEADPYVQELHRIEGEATTQRDQVPAYATATEPTVDAQKLSLPEMKGVLSALGVQFPENPTPEQLQAGFEIAATLPRSLAGMLLNPGMQVSYETPVAGVGTSPFIPVRAGANVKLAGQAELSDVNVGPGFEQTQTLDLQVELRGGAGFGTQTTLQQKIARWAGQAGWLLGKSDEVKQLIDSSPLLKHSLRGLPVSFSYEQFDGARLSYQAVVTPENGARIAGGDLTAAPNPFDPLAMPEGSAVLIRGQALEGSSLDVGYKLLRIGSTHTELEGLGFGVRRTAGSTVEVVAGPVSTVENDLFVGLGYRGWISAGISAQHSTESQSLRVATIDLSTQEGRDAYQTFLTTGQVPDWQPPGVPRSGTREVFESQQQAYAGLNVGSASIGIAGPGSDLLVAETRWQDGSVEQTTTYQLGNATSEVSFPRDGAGQPVLDQTTWRLVVADTHPALAGYLAAADTDPAAQVHFDGEQHVQYTFTTDELMALRQQARDSLQATIGGDFLERLDHGDVVVGIPDRDLAIATAKTPEEVFLALESHPDWLPEDLLAMAMGTGRTIPGRVEFRAAGD